MNSLNFEEAGSHINFTESQLAVVASNLDTSRLRTASFEDPIGKHLIDGKYLTSFKQKDILGYGGFGVVWKVQHKLEKQEYAVKICPLSLDIEAIVTRSLFREIDAMLRMNNVRVVRYVTCWLESLSNLEGTLKMMEEDSEDESGSQYSDESSSSSRTTKIISVTEKVKVGLFIQMELVVGSTLK
jgi:serine/threonine protein kinase